MKCPDTPKSVISEMLEQGKEVVWQKAWSTFFEIYYSTMLAMARNTFYKIGWSNVSQDDLEEVVSKSVVSIINAFAQGKYQKDKYRFRGFLKQIITCRIIDFLRKQNKEYKVQIEALDMLDSVLQQELGMKSENQFEILEGDEVAEYKKSIVMDAWENIRSSFSPQTCLIFEMSHLECKSPAEISELLGVKRSIIDSCVHRVLTKLKAKLNEADYRKELEL